MRKNQVLSTRVPVYRDSGFVMNDPYEMGEAFAVEASAGNRDPEHFIYSRYRNPTVVAAEDEIMKAEGAGWAILTQSGMAAIDVAVSLFQRGKETRPWLFFSEIYGGTISYINSVLLHRRGITVEWFRPDGDSYSTEKLKEVLETIRPEFLYFEAVSNPMLIVADGAEIIKLCREAGVKTIVDNTFATPFLWKPLEYGADLVIHSATKYFSGHGNLTAGVLCGNNPELMREAVTYRKFVGHMLSPDDAYRLHTQLNTFQLRFPAQCENAMRAATILRSHKVVEKVWYPGMDDHITHNTALRLFGGRGFGAMVTFTFSGNTSDKRNRRDRFIELVKEHIRLVPTLGDPHTILMPVEPVWGDRYPDAGMIRLSIGFESFEVLESTLVNALMQL